MLACSKPLQCSWVQEDPSHTILKCGPRHICPSGPNDTMVAFMHMYVCIYIHTQQVYPRSPVCRLHCTVNCFVLWCSARSTVLAFYSPQDGSHLHTVVAAGSDSVPLLGRWSSDSLLKRMELGKKPWSKIVLEHTGTLNAHMRAGNVLLVTPM